MSILFSILCLCACLSVSLQLRLGLHVLALDSRVSGNKTKKNKNTLHLKIIHFTLDIFFWASWTPLFCLKMWTVLAMGELTASLSFSNINNILSFMLNISYSAQSP